MRKGLTVYSTLRIDGVGLRMYVVLFDKSVILFNTGYGVSAWIFRFLLWLCIFSNSETPLSIVWWTLEVRRNICDTDTLDLPSDLKQTRKDRQHLTGAKE